MTAPTELPAWGSAPPAEPTSRFTVVGFYGYNGQRFCEHVYALDARTAEDQVRRDLAEQRADDGTPADPQVCGILAAVDGRVQSMDAYATYLDPDLKDEATS